MEEHIHYEAGAKQGKPRDASDLPAKPANDAPTKDAAESQGPGVVRRNVSPARPRSAALEREND